VLLLAARPRGKKGGGRISAKARLATLFLALSCSAAPAAAYLIEDTKEMMVADCGLI
jgi:hypothetical protein